MDIGKGLKCGMAFRREDYVQVVEAARLAGLTVSQTTIYPDGRIVIYHESKSIKTNLQNILSSVRKKVEESLFVKFLKLKLLVIFWRIPEINSNNIIKLTISFSKKVYHIWLIDVE